MNKLESLSVEGDTPVIEIFNGSIGILSRTEHVIFCLNLGDHPLILNTTYRSIVNKYREGKVKSTPARRVK